MLRLIASAILAALVVTAGSLAKPERKLPPPAKDKKARALPDLEKLNPTNWGDIRQVGRNFIVTGHPAWEAVGVIREDGTISLLWTMLSTGEPCPGEYEAMPSGELSGLWGYSHEGEVKDGKIVGLPRPDRLYKLLPPEPDFQ